MPCEGDRVLCRDAAVRQDHGVRPARRVQPGLDRDPAEHGGAQPRGRGPPRPDARQPGGRRQGGHSRGGGAVPLAQHAPADHLLPPRRPQGQQAGGGGAADEALGDQPPRRAPGCRGDHGERDADPLRPPLRRVSVRAGGALPARPGALRGPQGPEARHRVLFGNAARVPPRVVRLARHRMGGGASARDAREGHAPEPSDHGADRDQVLGVPHPRDPDEDVRGPQEHGGAVLLPRGNCQLLAG
mmetsp:Transcript_61353/g.146099  ORF Transcript_61353/g.146099 Transcript_61353/m.146099 type:complete len:243 (+) Transcript_61353:1611-2339(+)